MHTKRVDGVTSQAALSPVIDRPDRRMSLLQRCRNFISRPRFEGNFRRAATELAAEWWTAKRANFREWRNDTPRILKIRYGADDLRQATSVAIYVHYARNRCVSAMVRRQIEEYRALGFRVIFITVSEEISEVEIASLTEITALIMHRRNFSLDFGAWADVAAMLPVLAPEATELLLVNDSVCGPLHRLDKEVGSMRASGEGMFGLTENLAPRPHLQSYFLLVRGERAVADALAFLRKFRLTAYKRAVIRRGEVRLSYWMRKRGHLVAAVHGYSLVEWIALQQPRALARLRHVLPATADAAATSNWTTALRKSPLNPTHSLWYELVESCGFPFLKADLLIRNPAGVSDLDDWTDLIPAGSPELRSLIEEHLGAKRAPAMSA